MDDLAELKIILFLAANFIFSCAVSNWLVFEVDLIRSPITSLKIFCSTYCLGYVILAKTTEKYLAAAHVQNKVSN